MICPIRLQTCGLLLPLLILDVVGRAAVLRYVQAGLLILGTDAQQVEHLEDVEKRHHVGGNPSKDDEHTDDLACKQPAVATGVERAVAALVAVCLQHVLLAGDASGPQARPHTDDAVHGRGTQRVVDLELEEQPARALEDAGANKAGDDGGPRLQHVRAGRDGHKADEHIVGDGQQVPRLGLEEAEHQARQPAGRARQRGAHSSTAHDGRRLDRRDDEDRARVEAVPAKPQEARAQHDEGGGVAGHVDGVAVRVEAAHAWADEDSTPHAGEAANHVHDGRASKVDEATVEQGRAKGVIAPVSEPAGGRPHPVHDDGVDPCRDEPRVAQVGVEVEALCNTSRRDGRCRCGKRPLEEPVLPVHGAGHARRFICLAWPVHGPSDVSVLVRDRDLICVASPLRLEVGKREHASTDEAIGTSCRFLVPSVTTISECPPDEIEREARYTGVQDGHQQDVHGVLGADGTRAQHGKTSVHDEDQRAAEDEQHRIHALLNVGHLVLEQVQVLRGRHGAFYLRKTAAR
mmetsp:Transcript_11999/g.25068  ORF Transcript_11999/g.25068 Transcript_11999/m.25068 type:complete len:518 (+) Transcript_11999:290-1843(+)